MDREGQVASRLAGEPHFLIQCDTPRRQVSYPRLKACWICCWAIGDNKCQTVASESSGQPSACCTGGAPDFAPSSIESIDSWAV